MAALEMSRIDDKYIGNYTCWVHTYYCKYIAYNHVYMVMVTADFLMCQAKEALSIHYL